MLIATKGGCMRRIITAVFAFVFCFGVSANAVAQTNHQNTTTQSHSVKHYGHHGSPGYAQGSQMTKDLNMLSEQSAQEGLMIITPLIHEYVYEDITEIKIPARHERRMANMFTSYYNEADDFYSNFKKGLQEDMGFSYGFDWSLTAQRGAPGGKQTSLQTIYYPYAQLNLFNTDSLLGSAQINFNYTLVRYWGITGNELNGRLGTVTAINDYPGRQDLFSQLTFNHTWGGDLSWFSWAIGQYPIYNFDGTTYNSNQQTGLINYSMSQNATATYPQASFGAYAEISPMKELTIAGGYQDATNVSGRIMDMDTAFDGKYTGFGSITYTPTIGSSKGQYSALVYYQPSVNEQLGNSMGWSFNMEQNLSKKIVMFGRANGSTNNISPIRNSYMLGMAFVDPLSRNPLDTITFGIGYNKMAKGDFSNVFARTGETVFEAQWVWGFSQYLTITPDLQFYNRGALNTDDTWVSVFTLRATVMI